MISVILPSLSFVVFAGAFLTLEVAFSSEECVPFLVTDVNFALSKRLSILQAKKLTE